MQAESPVPPDRRRQFSAQRNKAATPNLFGGGTRPKTVYGNLTRVTGPSGYTIDYVYDTDVFTYIASVTDSFGYRSHTVWDYRWGAPVRETDIGGAEMRRDYDAFGRLRRVWGPYDRYPDGTPALTMEYYPDEFPGRAVTHNKVHFDPANDRTIATVIIADGLRRVLQTKADGEVYDPESDRSTIGMSVSGRVEYDEVGRVRAEHQPAFEPGTDYTWTGRSPERRPTIREHDILGRVVRQTLPDTSTTTTAYRIEGGRDVVVSTDPEGRVVSRSSDVRGNIIAVTDYPAGTATTTAYTYNILGEILTVTDPHGNVIASTYDTLGRRTALQTPNSGTVEYSYDLAGNLLTRVDEALRESGGIIRYEYEFNRLTRIRYPESDEVSYEYGEATAGYDAGRTIRVSDQAGITRYRYGAMGETTEITRTLERLTPGREDAPETYTLGYTWDYQGRMERIVYPDGEELVYSYDHGGQVTRAVGEWGTTEYVYVDQIGYDEFGQRNYIRYGNGVETTYSYDPDRRWLDHIHTATGRGEVLQDMDYGFDRVGNILTTINDGERRRVSQSYRYDDRHQLIAADGETIARMGGLELWRNEYSQAYAYDAIGNMVSKTGTNRIMPTGERPEHLNYTLGYTYDPLRPHQATVIGDREYRYDLNGNVREVIRAGTGSEGGGHDPSAYRDLGEHRGHAPEAFGRFGAGGGEEPERIARYEWNEENRLVESETGDGIVARYRYDANGIRSTRYSALYGETLYADRMYQENFGANPPALATKHIFVGETRIASKLHYRDQTGGTRALFMERNTYWYHADHLGSTNWVTDHEGEGYEHFQYTPYGESWISEQLGDTVFTMTHRFTGQELDPETGLYAFPARNYDPRTSRWLSVDPAMEAFLPYVGQNPDDLPGMGGVFDPTNLAAYHFSSNNPLRYVDPTGMADDDKALDPTYFQQQDWEGDGDFDTGFWETACAATAILNEVSERYTMETGEQLTTEMGKQMLLEGIDSGNLTSVGFVNSWDGAANAMWDLTELSGEWSYSESPGMLSEHSIFFVYTRGQAAANATGPGGHFVNSTSSGYFDTWGGTTGSRPYTPQQTQMVERASGARYGPSHQRLLSTVRGVRNLWFGKPED